MKRRFTFMMAAFALLAFLAIPLGMRADAGDVHDMNITQSTLLNNNNAIPSINIDAQSYPIEAVTINWRYNKTIANPVTIEVLVDGTSWGTQTITGNTTADAIFEGSATVGPIVINFTNNTGSGTGHGTFNVNSVKLTEGLSGDTPPAPTYTVTFDVGDGTFDGNDDFPELENEVVAGSHTLPSAHKDGFTFTGWMDDFTEYEYAGGYTFPVIGDVSFTAQYTENTTPPGPGPSGEEVTYDFTEIDGFATWTNSYLSHTVTYSDAIVTFASASHQTSTITNQPVTKGGAVTLVLTDGSTMSSATFVCTQWTTKAQTITLHYSTDSGETYTSTGITSTNFTITDNNLPAGTNAVKITFSSSSNQVGIASATIVKVGSTPSTNPSIDADNVEIAYDAISGAIGYTINNPVEGGTLTAFTNDNWLTLDTADTIAVPFTCSVNAGLAARTATVTLTYTYGENDETVTKEVTVTQAGNPNVASITVNPTTVSVTADEAEGTLTVTYNNITEVVAEVYICDAEGQPVTYDWFDAEIDSLNNVYYLISANDGEARTAYLKVYALDDELHDVYSDLIAINQAAYVIDYTVLPFEWAGGPKESLTALVGVTGYGLGSNYAESNAPYRVKFDSDGDYILIKTDRQPGVVTLGIKKLGGSGETTIAIKGSSDGVNYTTIEEFTNSGESNAILNHQTTAAFGENDRYVMIYFNKPSTGANVGVGPITISIPSTEPAITLSPATVDVAAEGVDSTIMVTYHNITNVAAEVYFCDASGNAITYDWIDAEIDNDNNVYYVVVANEGEARTAYFKVYALDDNAEGVYSNLVTINQAAYIAPPVGNTYMLYSGDLVEGDYVIYYDGAAMKNTVANNRLSYEVVTPEDGVIVTEDATIVWHIAPSGDYWTIYNVAANAYAAGTNTKNTAQMQADGTDALALWTVSGTNTYDFENYGRSQASSDFNNKYLRRNGTYGFACYSASIGGALSLYKSTGGLPYVAKPTFSPAPGSYAEDQYVTISCSTQDAVIYYTIDGTDPTVESDVFADSILVSEGITTIKAIAVLDTIVSSMATGVYDINPNAPGSLENPYTVPQAIAAAPASGTTDFVYVQGVVSRIITTADQVIQYHNISYNISVDGSTNNQLLVRYGKNLYDSDFYSIDELQLGDRVIVYGKLEKDDGTPRVAAYNYLVSLERDVEPPFFSPGSCMLANDENAIVYIFCDTYEAEIHYTMDGTAPNMDSPLFDEGTPINLQGETGTITINAIAYYEGMHSAITSVTYRMVAPGTPGTMETPYTVREILDLMDSIPNINQVYVHGIVCTNPIIEEDIYHNANYYISDDGTAGEANQLYVYRGKGLGGEPFTSDDDLRKGDIVTVLGDLQIYNGKKEFKQYSIIYEWERLSSITVTSESADCKENNSHLDVGYYNIYFQGNPPRVQLCDEQGNAAEYDWITVTLNGSELDFHLNAAAENEVPRTAYLKVIGGDWSGNEVVSNIASITQNECVYAPLPFHYAYNKLDSESDADVLARLDSIPDGLEVVGLGDYYATYPYLKFDAPNDTTGQADYIKLAFNEEAARLMFDIQGANGFRGGYFYLQTSANGLDWTNIAVYTTADLIAQMGDDNPLKPIAEVLNTDNYKTITFDNLPSDVRYIRWIYGTRSVGNVRLGGIHLYRPEDIYNIVLNQPEYDSCFIAADKAIAVEGETVELSYVFAGDYYLNGWNVTDGNGDAVEVNNNRFTMPASDVTVAALIGWIERYDIVLNQPEFDSCSISADKTVAAEGETVTLSYELAEGYYFIEWNVTDGNGDPVTVSDNQFVMPASRVTVEAVIVEATTEYQYVYSVNGVETEPQTAVIGATITLDNGANIGAFEFIGWTTDPNDVENVMPAEASYTIMEDVIFYAVYSTNVASYVKVNSTEEITNGNYLIVCEEASAAFNGGLTTLDGTNNKINVTIDGNVIAADVVTNASTFTINVDNQTLQSASGFYIGVPSNSNGLKQSVDSSVYHNSFAIDENGDAVISAVFNGSNMVLRFNSASNQNRFRYYSGTQTAIQLYKYVGSDLYTRVFVDNPEGAVAISGPSIIPSGYVLEVSSITNELGADKLLIEEGAQLVTSNTVNATMRKTINGFEGDANDSYCFISSPVNDQDPADLGMVDGNYDLYYFDQDSTDAEWQNYKVVSFNLTTGNGYLYAKAMGGTITIAGTMTNSFVGNTTLNGWYLIGNPYPCNVTINVPYYRLDESGAALVLTESSVAIAPMEGVLVHVEGDTIVFTKAPQTSTMGNTGSKVIFNVKP